MVATVGETSPLVTEDYMVAFNGLALGGSSEFNLEAVEGLLSLPGLSTFDQQRTYRHGADPGFDTMGGRTVIISGDIVTDDDADIDERMTDFLAAFAPGGGTEGPLVFQIPGVAGGAKGLVYGRVRDRRIDVDATYMRGLARFIVRIDSTSPYIYSAAESTYVVDQSTAGSENGFAFPEAFDWSFGGGTSPTQTTVVNGGTTPAEWEAVINGPVVNPLLTNQNTGEFMDFTITLTAGQTLTVNSTDRTIRLNGSTNRYSTLTSTSSWFDIDVGSVDLSYTYDSTTGTTTCDFSMRNHFL